MHGAIDYKLKVTLFDLSANVGAVYIVVVRKQAVKREPSPVTLRELALSGTKRVRIRKPRTVHIHHVRPKQRAKPMK